MSLTLRTTKGNPLTNQELDNNFVYLDGRISATSVTISDLTNVTLPNLQQDVSDLTSQKQNVNPKLTSLSGMLTSGLVVHYENNVVPRQLVAGSDLITITNADGVADNPSIDVGSKVVTLDGTQTLTNKTISGQNNTITNIPMSAAQGSLGILNGGHGGTTAGQARTNLQVLKNPTGTGIVVKTGDDVTVVRGIISDGVGLTITNGTGVDNNIVIGSNATADSTANTIVARDGSGNFTANIITATLSGHATTSGSTLNGVVTTGSYSDPQWITSLAGSKVTSIPNSSLENSSITINGQAIALGESGTLTIPEGVATNTPNSVVSRDANGNFAANQITATLNGSATSAGSATTAGTAVRLATARKINGVDFDGSADITIADSTKLPLAGGAIPVTGQLQVKQVEYVASAGNTGTSFTPNWANGTIQYVSVNDSFTLNNPINMPAGASLTLILTVASAGKFMTVAAESSYKFAGNFKQISSTLNAVDIISIFNSGFGYFATLSTGYM